MTRNTPKEIRYDKLGPQVAKALEKRRFAAYYRATKEEALDKALELIPADHTVGWGGSVTLEELGLPDALRKKGQKLIDRDKAGSTEERERLMREILLCDTFLMSANAVSEDGVLVNLDGTGNRVAGLIYGPKQVLVIAGMNKVVKTQADAVSRCRNIAAPVNAQRFGLQTPCSVSGACADCTSPDCICNYLTIARGCRPAQRIKVILVGEDMGF